DVLRVAVACSRGVAEVARGPDGLGPELGAGGGGRLRGRAVVPDAGEVPAGRVPHMRGAGRAGAGAAGDQGPVAVLGHDARPQLTVGAEALEHLLELAGPASGIAAEGEVAVAVGAGGPPLGAPEHEVDLRRAARDTDAVDTAAVGQGLRAGRRDVGMRP